MGQTRQRWAVWMVLAAIAAVMSMPGVVSAQNGSDKAVAHVDLQPFNNNTQWDISARSNFNGTQPSGSWRATFVNLDPNLVISGEITCLQVLNNVAFVGGIVTNVRGGTAFGNTMWASMTDSGKFGTTPDLFGAFVFTGTADQVGTCPVANSLTQQPVIDGQVIVQDTLN